MFELAKQVQKIAFLDIQEFTVLFSLDFSMANTYIMCFCKVFTSIP